MAKKVQAEQTTDQKTLALIEQVKTQRKEIAAAQKPKWETNMTFPLEEGTPKVLNLHVETNVGKLVKLAAMLRSQQEAYTQAARELAVDAPEFTWGTFTVDNWLKDFKTRINIIQLTQKKKKLEDLENRLNLIISPALRAKMELEAIESELNK